jgi:hypothetical protein
VYFRSVFVKRVAGAFGFVSTDFSSLSTLGGPIKNLFFHFPLLQLALPLFAGN